MKRKTKKIISIVSVIVFLVVLSGNAFAAVSDFKGTTDALEGKDTIVYIISTILDVARTVGVGIAVIMLMLIGCKYMLASAGERAEIKKYATNYIIGAVVLFAASGFISIIRNFVEGSMG